MARIGLAAERSETVVESLLATRLGSGSVEVYANTTPVTRLNELEYIQGMVLANI